MGSGYYRQPEETAAAFADGWLRTGDLGYLDEDRELFLVGRQKELIIQSGVKVAPRDVVEVVRRLPGVEECAVVGVPHAVLGEQVVACVVRRAESQITGDEILAHCRAHLEPRQGTRARVVLRGTAEDAERQDQGPGAPPAADDRAGGRDRDRPGSAASFGGAGATAAGAPRGRASSSSVRILPARPSASRPLPIACGATFGELGLDSLAWHNWDTRSMRRSDVPSPRRSSSAIPTVDALCRHLVAEIARRVAGAGVTRRCGALRPVSPWPSSASAAVCREARTRPSRSWSLLQRGVDATAEISRWNVDAVYDPARGTAGRMYTRRAALLDDGGPVRRRVLRRQPARSPQARSAAPARARSDVGSARARRLRSPRPGRRAGRAVPGHQQLVGGGRRRARRGPVHGRRARLPFPRPARARGRHRHVVLVVAGGGPPRRPEPPSRRVRHRA